MPEVRPEEQHLVVQLQLPEGSRRELGVGFAVATTGTSCGSAMSRTELPPESRLTN